MTGKIYISSLDFIPSHNIYDRDSMRSELERAAMNSEETAPTCHLTVRGYKV